MQNLAVRATDHDAEFALGVRIATLQSRFGRNLVDAVTAWSKHLVDETRLAGVPEPVREAARRRAQLDGLEGFRLTLDDPTYEAVMRRADDRELRREVYEAYITRASDRGPLAGRFDNGPIIDGLLALRHEHANQLGHRNYADAVAKTTVAGSAEDGERLLLELNALVRPRAQGELEEVWKLAKSRDEIKGFRPWDLPYYSEKLAEDRPERSTRALATLRQLEVALFDLRLHRDYLPAERASKLRSQVLDTQAQARREISLLPPPPWDRSACGLVEIFGDGQVGGCYYGQVLAP